MVNANDSLYRTCVRTYVLTFNDWRPLYVVVKKPLSVCVHISLFAKYCTRYLVHRNNSTDRLPESIALQHVSYLSMTKNVQQRVPQALLLVHTTNTQGCG